jgi:plastocyanin
MGTLSNLIRKVAFYSLLFAAVWSLGPANDKAGVKREPTTHVVVIKDFRFIPETLTVNAGDKIVWKNEDRAPHTATAQGVFDSGTIPYGKDWTWVAEGKGTFGYICTLHPRMKATLIVQ